jgi:hypothetical protein
MRGLLGAFQNVRLQAASIPARPFRWLPGGGRFRDALARGVGWFLYATGTRPTDQKIPPFPPLEKGGEGGFPVREV